ncbi:bacillithiol biosynthesis cysteine-adding enzyme BshC [Pedobacter sp. BS3]|uniref:bacillithiol biosynthesis cysteine-adding enzyme BshC n=1 Tax=Pedobacter sp. BS3 TaxID=2567937 RepID=UPI0011ED7888|nr:bacillithiol biosynthesis cysteine-adding enzyme BshC [Pedobacter sp. BS3]TZF82175.1 bacillithiol biosynthesis cysteine-adding enzyme BshC [Pedobacter sp. BS3]
MNATYIDYEETHAFSDTVISYLCNDTRLKPFIVQQADITGFSRLLQEKHFNGNRQLLAETLTNQYRDTGIKADENPVVFSNIESLKQENTYTVTTGHQLNIFTGPLYFIYKIVTAINLAKELKENFPDKHFVPVYWMATEDHDFAEINHTYLLNKKISWNVTASGATGRMATKTIAEAIKQYQGILGISANAVKLSRLIEHAYLNHHTLADATRYLVNALFSEYGLVIIDADNKNLKAQFAGIIEQDIIEQNSYRLIAESSEALQEAGFKTQVNAREINFFYLNGELRERLTEKDGQYFVLNSDISFTAKELRQEIRQHPERFSPNVILRPLYQEVILPNLAYIGGGAEIVYWLQLKKNFGFYEVDFPILILRNSAMIADDVIAGKLRRLDLNFPDLFKPVELIRQEWVKQHTDKDLSLADEWQEMRCIFEKIKLRAFKIDTTLAPSTEAVRERLHHQLQSLEKKLLKAEKRNYATALGQIERLREKLFPGGGLQERKENFGMFYVQYGDEFIRTLVRYFKPLDFKFTILY